MLVQSESNTDVACCEYLCLIALTYRMHSLRDINFGACHMMSSASLFLPPYSFHHILASSEDSGSSEPIGARRVKHTFVVIDLRRTLHR